MARPPGDLDVGRHRDLRGRRLVQPLRWLFLALLAAFLVLALLNVFGQRQSKNKASGSGATMSISAPSRIRGGLLYQARIHVQAHRAIKQPNILLDEGWLQQTTVNAIEPQPSNEGSENGKLQLSYDALKPGDSLVVWIYFQANPTNIGHHHTDVELDDGPNALVHIDRTQFNFP